MAGLSYLGAQTHACIAGPVPPEPPPLTRVIISNQVYKIFHVTGRDTDHLICDTGITFTLLKNMGLCVYFIPQVKINSIYIKYL